MEMRKETPGYVHSSVSHGDVVNRRALVTGASSGIGRAIAVELLADGFDLLLIGRDMSRLAELQQAAIKRPGAHVETAYCDLSRADQVVDIGERICRSGTPLDVLVNSAGVIVLNDIEHAELSDFDVMLETNLWAPLLLVRGLLPIMRAGSSIVFVNSLAGLRTSAANVLYSATKHALKAIADGLRIHVEDRGIRVLSIYPPLTATPVGQYVKSYYGSPYDPTLLLQPSTIATRVLEWIDTSRDGEIDMLFPTDSPSSGVRSPAAPSSSGPS